VQKQLNELGEKLLEILHNEIANLEEKGIGTRDYATILNALEKINQQAGRSAESEWRKQLEEIFEATDAIESLAFDGEADDFERVFGVKLVFDKRKKKLSLA